MTGYADIASTIAAVNLGKIQALILPNPGIMMPWSAAIREGLQFALLRQHNQLLRHKLTQNQQLMPVKSKS